jgi:hypothetical protein
MLQLPDQLHSSAAGAQVILASALTCAPQNSLGGVGSGVKTITSSPDSLRFLIRDSKRFFMPLMWLNGLGSTKMATLLGVNCPALLIAATFLTSSCLL